MFPFENEDAKVPPSKPSKCQNVENMATTHYSGQLRLFLITVYCLVRVLGCTHCSVEVAFCPELAENMYLSLQLGEKVLCFGSSHLL